MRVRARAATTLLALLACCDLVLAARPAGAQHHPSAAAQEQLARGVAEFDEGHYETALEALRRSLELYSSPNARLYVARCYARLGRAVDAAREYEVTAREANALAVNEPRYTETRDVAQRELAELEPGIGRLRVDVVPAAAARTARVEIAGRELPREMLGQLVPVPAGDVRVQVHARGYETGQFEVGVGLGQRVRARAILVPLPPPPPRVLPPRPPSRGAWPAVEGVALGVGLAGVVAFGALLAVDELQYRSLIDRCGHSPCPLDLQDQVQAGITIQTSADAALIAGLVGLAVAAGAYGLERLTAARRANTPGAPRARLAAPGRIGVQF